MLLAENGKIVPRQPIQDASLWGRDDFGPKNDWKVALPPNVIADIEAALPGLKKASLHPKDIRPEHFPLPNSSVFLEEVNRSIEIGPGFALLTGFPIKNLGTADASLAYQGFMSHFGRIAIQNRIGEYVVEVSDKGRGLGPQARGHYGNAELNFHADGANAVSLLCLETAPEGGQSLLIGAAAVYNTILTERPDILPILERGFHHHRRDEREENDPKVTPWRTPVFAYYDDRLHLIYTRISIDYCEAEGIEITPEEKDALDFLDNVLGRPHLQVSMDLAPGDLQIVNNFLCLHARTSYRDSETQKRRLIRLWLDNAKSLRNGPGKMDWYMPEHSRFLRERRALLEYPLNSKQSERKK